MQDSDENINSGSSNEEEEEEEDINKRSEDKSATPRLRQLRRLLSTI